MNARSLIGMTQGARKRHIRYIMAWPPRPDGLSEEDARAHLRTVYRIGQRLRPCRGCYGCTAQTVLVEGEKQIHWQSGEASHQATDSNPISADADLCDGSGVIVQGAA